MWLSLKQEAGIIRANCASQKREPTAAEYDVLARRKKQVVQRSALPAVVSCFTPLALVGLGIHIYLRSQENRLTDQANAAAERERIATQRYARTQQASLA